MDLEVVPSNPAFSNHETTRMNAPFFVLDNGADTIKAGFGGDCKTIPNCIARGRDRRTFIGSNLEKCRDFAGISFRRPHERGYMVSWEAEKVIWDELFEDLKVDPAYTSLVLAEPPFVPPHLQHACDQIVFEEFGFESYTRQVVSRPQTTSNYRVRVLLPTLMLLPLLRNAS